MRGTRSDWYWDVSLQGGRNGMDFNITNTLNASLGPAITSKTEFYAGTFVADQVARATSISRASSKWGWPARSTSPSGPSSGATAIS